MLNSVPPDGLLRRRAEHRLGFSGPLAGAVAQPSRPPPGYPDFGPRPASAARPPRPAPGPRWRQRSVTAPLLSFLRSAPCQEGEALLHPMGQGPWPSAWRRAREGRPARERGLGAGGGRRGGGEVARTGCGRGGELHSGSHRLLPAPASTFCTAQSGTSHQPLGSCHGLHPGGRTAELGAGAPNQSASRLAEANLAARPAPQPFSRGTWGSGRGGCCGGCSCSCCRCSTTCPFPGSHRPACQASPSPPPKLPTAPGPRAVAPAASAASSTQYPRFPSPHLPTVSEVIACQLLSPPPRWPPWAPVREAPLPAAAAVPEPGSPLVRFTATIHQITSCWADSLLHELLLAAHDAEEFRIGVRYLPSSLDVALKLHGLVRKTAGRTSSTYDWLSPKTNVTGESGIE